MQYVVPTSVSPVGISRRIGVFLRNGLTGLMVLLLSAAGLFAATPVLSRLELIGSGRGLALTLGADAAFGISVSEKASDKSMTSIVSIKCSNVIYGLDEYQFTVFPRGAPVKQITARENKESGSVELLIKVLTPPDKNIRFKQKDTRWVVLLTSAPVNDFAWSAQNETQKLAAAGGPEDQIVAKRTSPTAAARTGPPQVTASSFLEDITILHRERVEKVVFKFDAPTEMIVKSMPEKIMVLFVNAKNSLSHGTFKSEKDWLVKSIELKEVIHGGTRWLGASIFVNREGGVKPLVQTFSDRLVVYSVRDTKQCLYLWSAKNGTTLSYNFISPQEFKVDLKKIENRALSDSKSDIGKTGTFSVKESAPQPPQSAEAPPPQRVIRMVMIKDSIALRSNPSSAPPSTVSSYLPLGAIATQLEKKGLWMYIDADGTRGWIGAAMAMDSMKVSTAFWKKIEAAKIAAAKREEKIREAERIRQEKKIQQEQLALAKQKAVEEQKEKAREAERIQQEKKIQEEQLAIAKQKALQEEKEKQAERIAAKAPVPAVAPMASPPPPVVKTSQLEKGKETVPQQPPMASAAVLQKPEQKLIEYQVYGRDPFLPLKEDEEGPLPNVEKLQVVGILFDRTARIALLEDTYDKSNAYALRENDPVKNGYLLRIQPDKVIFLLNEFGMSRSYILKLSKDKLPEAIRDRSNLEQ